MTTITCNKADCTVATTGKCLEAHTPPETCPFFSMEVAKKVALAEPVDEGSDDSAGDSAESERGRQFPAGLELGYSDVLSLSRSRYMHLVAVLGATNAGKTCLLISLYLLALNRMLAPRFRFAGSRTLMGFEYRARGLRKWTRGALPRDFADHTQLGDPRAPAFMHLAFDENVTGPRRREFLFTDLPGEWTTELIDRSETADRFQFLSRADAVVLVLDGPRLDAIATRQQDIMQTEHLLQRLAETINLHRATPIVFVISKCDELTSHPTELVQRLQVRASEYGFQSTVIETAAISREPNRIPNGQGMSNLLEVILQTQPPQSSGVSDTATGARSMHGFERARRSQ